MTEEAELLTRSEVERLLRASREAWERERFESMTDKRLTAVEQAVLELRDLVTPLVLASRELADKQLAQRSWHETLWGRSAVIAGVALAALQIYSALFGAAHPILHP